MLIGIKYLPRDLQHLDLFACVKVGDDGLKDLPPNLKFLNLSQVCMLREPFCDVQILFRFFLTIDV